MQRRTITLLIMGTVFTAGLWGFGGYVFAGENYNSSKSNTSTGIINRDVGNLLIDYGYGGEVVNQVTEALARGVTTDGLRAILGATSARSPEVVEEVLQKLEVELERLGISEDDTQAVSTPDATGAVPRTSEGTVKPILPSKRAEPAPSKTEIIEIKDGGDMSYRRVLLQQGVQALRQNLQENTKELRENFRENVKTTIGHVDHGKTARIAVAHGKGLRMINRYRSAMARFDHILGRMESRVQKLEAQGVDVSAVILLVEEAKNMSVENEAKLEELKVKYESLLTGENPQGVAGKAREIAKELKVEIEKLHAKLRKIATAIIDFTTPTYEPEKTYSK